MNKIKDSLSPEWAELYDSDSRSKRIDIVTSIISIIFVVAATVIWVLNFN